MLDETALRRTNFREDLRVKLADGQEWWLSRPVIRTGMGGKRSCSLGPDYLTKWNEFREIQERMNGETDDSPTFARTMEEWQDSRLSLIGESLRCNYDLTDDQVADLVMFDLSDNEDGGEGHTFNRAFAVAFGVSPKILETGSKAG